MRITGRYTGEGVTITMVIIAGPLGKNTESLPEPVRFLTRTGNVSYGKRNNTFVYPYVY